MGKYAPFWKALVSKITDPSNPFYDWKNQKNDQNHISKVYGDDRGLTWKLHLNHYGFPATVELYIYYPDDAQTTREIYEFLLANSAEIEIKYGSPLAYNLHTKPNSKINVVYKAIVDTGHFDEMDSWDNLQYTMIAEMQRLRDVLTPYIERFKSGNQS